MRISALSGVLVGAAILGGAAGYPLDAKRPLVTEVVYVTVTVGETVIYVDDKGTPIYTTSSERITVTSSSGLQSSTLRSSAVTTTSTAIELTQSGPAESSSFDVSILPSSLPTSSIASDVQATSSPQVTKRPSENTSMPASAQPSTSVAEAPSPSQATPTLQPSSPPKQPDKVTTDRFPLGVTYDTYKGTQDSVQCKTSEEMTAEFEKMKEFGIVRIYGNDCGVIPVAIQQAKKNNQKLMAGIYAPNQRVDDVVNALSDAVNRYNGGDWSIISLVSVENERVNARVVTVAAVHDYTGEAREALSKVGYFGPLGPVETVPAVIDNPELCTNSDLTLVNVHAFFDPNTKAEDAGPFVKREVQRVQEACPNKRVVVTESGWPSQGTSHDKAEVSKSAQIAAINSLKASFDHDLFLFNAFDSPWKTDDQSTWNSERWWGIL
ncbi:glycoside hydrolase family 17 protein [Periconia macrospinosa]|uniref:Glycoside hydrolase family 17 protein n=1 Tax=Periconia macrospinosa TaxID=97972 RepID=A0A2V1EBD1_9PLEO|nr:glycoside hydrolase family 17 protein [Periconia macrospinosa]